MINVKRLTNKKLARKGGEFFMRLFSELTSRKRCPVLLISQSLYFFLRLKKITVGLFSIVIFLFS